MRNTTLYFVERILLTVIKNIFISMERVFVITLSQKKTFTLLLLIFFTYFVVGYARRKFYILKEFLYFGQKL